MPRQFHTAFLNRMERFCHDKPSSDDGGSGMSTPELVWLSPAPVDWNATLRDVGPLADLAAWQALVELANFRLDSLATTRLDRRQQALFGDEPPAGLVTRPVRMAVLASSTIDHLVPALRVAALRRDIWLHVHTGEYGQYGRELSDPTSDLHDYAPDTVLFALDAHHLLAGCDAGLEDAEARFAQVTNMLVSNWRQARRA